MSAPTAISPSERWLRQAALIAMVATALAVLSTGLYLYRPGTAAAQTAVSAQAPQPSNSADPVRKESTR